MYDIEVDQAVITRDFAFDESTFGFLPSPPLANETNLKNISSNESCTKQFEQTGKRKSCAENQERVTRLTLPTHRVIGLEEASAPNDTKLSDDQALNPIWIKSAKQAY